MINVTTICFAGQQLSDEVTTELPHEATQNYGNPLFQSFSIGYAFYSSDWQNASNETKKMIMIIIMRCQKPLLLSAVSFQAMSFPTLVAVREYLTKHKQNPNFVVV